MSKFGETYNRLLNELAIPPAVIPVVKAVGGAGARAAVTRGLVALGGGLATLMNNKTQQQTKTATKTKRKTPDVGETELPGDIKGVKDTIVQSKFNEYYENIMGEIVKEAAPLLLAAPAAAKFLAAAVPAAIGTAATIGLGKTAYDAATSLNKPSTAQTTTAASPAPTTTATPATAPKITSTTTPPVVATPTSTTTPDTDMSPLLKPLIGVAAATNVLPIAKAIAGTRAISRTRTQTQNRKPDIEVGDTNAGANLQGVQGPIVQDTFILK